MIDQYIVNRILDTIDNMIRSVGVSLSQIGRRRINIRSSQCLAHATLTTTEEVIYSTPDRTNAVITEIFLANLDTVNERYVTVALVPPDETYGNAHIIIPSQELLADEHMQLPMDTVIPSGWRIYAKADAADDVNIHVSGVEVAS